MARVRMVTRTVSVTVATTMVVNVDTANVEILDLEVSGTFDNNDAVLKAVKKHYESEHYKCVAIQATSVNEVLYGMPEADFIKLAKVLPPRGTKETDEE